MIPEWVREAVGQARAFAVSTPALAPAAALGVNVTFEVPAGAPARCLIWRIALTTLKAGGGFAGVRINPTLNLPATAPRVPANMKVGAPQASVAIVRADPGLAMTGGILSDLVLGQVPDAREEVDLPPMVIAPGLTLGISLPGGAGLLTALSVWWVEDYT